VTAKVGGGDGATLFPFEATARSHDGGQTWTTYDVAAVDGERAYTSGQVVLSDGRLLVLLTSWSDDRRSRPGPRHHGLWVSDGDDWSRFTPYDEASFLPPPGPPPAGGRLAELSWQASLGADPQRGGVIWLQGWDDRLYVSSDAARTFRAIPARPAGPPAASAAARSSPTIRSGSSAE
jgi:hypothetical protein